MMPQRRLVGGIIVALFVLIAGAFLYLDYSISKFGECRVVHLTSIPSPEGRKSVVTVRKECGATVPDSTQASIVSAGGLFVPEQASTFLSVRGHQDVVVTWSGEHVVRIGLIPGSDTVYRRDLNVGDIKIEYE